MVTCQDLSRQELSPEARKEAAMDWWQGALVMVGVFGLRLGVPLGITLILSYGLHRLDLKWRVEATTG
jgi:hypothetical protein